MTKISVAMALMGFMTSFSALADDHGGWARWVQVANASTSSSTDSDGDSSHSPSNPVAVVPAGSAKYTGATVALITDSSSGTAVKSVSTGAVNLNVTFSGTGTTTETGTITGLTGTAGTKVGDLAFTASGSGSRFSGTVTSATYPAVAATSTTAATGTGSINGGFSAPVLVTPAVAATSTTAAVAAVYSAPLAATGNWGFTANSTLKASGSFAAVKQ